MRACDDGADARPALRFLTCGSVDDGKSTLIGRLLYEQNLIFDDHLAALERDSKKHGTNGAEVDFALLLDGLEAEREQGITIDVAYRYFSTPRRAFIVADTPGHEQYTRNMATGASNADLAVLLVDARKGLLSQTRRHAIIASLLGIRYVVLAVNKIDLVGLRPSRVRRDRGGALEALPPNSASRRSRRFRFRRATATMYRRAASARPGIPARICSTIWKRSTSRTTAPASRSACRCNGSIGPIPISAALPARSSSGSVRPGDEIAVLPSGQTTRIKAIIGAGGDLDAAQAGDAVTVTLADEIDIARGDMLAALRDRPQVADQFARASGLDGERAAVPGPLLSDEDQ